MSWAGMTLLLVGSLGLFAWSAARRIRQLRIGRPEPTFRIDGPELAARVKDVVVIALGQKKMPYYRLAGVAHMMIFGGFVVLLLNSVLLWARGYDVTFDFFGLLAHGTWAGAGYTFVKELFASGVLLGTLVFFYYRIVRRGNADTVSGKPRMTLGLEGLLILGIISTMMLADFTYVGAHRVLQARATGVPLAWHWAEPVASVVAQWFSGLSGGTLVFLLHLGFWWHSSFVLIFLNILPYSKHFHILTSLPNVFTRPPPPPGKLPTVTDLEGKVEREEPVGIKTIKDVTWKQILDLYTCTECGRCSDNCPAYVTDKVLSPKHLTLALRDHLYASEPRTHSGEGAIVPPMADPEPPVGEKEPLHTNPPAPEGGYFLEPRFGVDLVPNVLHPDVLWACTTCRACEEQCPVQISYVDKIVGMRRELVMIKNEFPAELTSAFDGMERNGNPWKGSRMDRGTWADGLDVPFLAERPDAEVLYWVGCAASYEDRAKRIARAVARLLKKAEVDFAILGTEENCTGDPARRAGNEYLFQTLAQANVETLNGYGVSGKTIITPCPHCFNTLKNEYKDFGGHYEVVHHSEFLQGLIARGKLVPTKRVRAKIAFHDSCYLGRHNDVYESPREVLRAIPGVELVEVPYWNKKKGLCCGAGGAQMFMEEQNTNRVSNKRSLQLVDTGADTIASACPFCQYMLTDGLKAQEKEEEVAQLDIAELLEKAIDFGGTAPGEDEDEAEAAE